jgi:hypothetical protein
LAILGILHLAVTVIAERLCDEMPQRCRSAGMIQGNGKRTCVKSGVATRLREGKTLHLGPHSLHYVLNQSAIVPLNTSPLKARRYNLPREEEHLETQLLAKDLCDDLQADCICLISTQWWWIIALAVSFMAQMRFCAKSGQEAVACHFWCLIRRGKRNRLTSTRIPEGLESAHTDGQTTLEISIPLEGLDALQQSES